VVQNRSCKTFTEAVLASIRTAELSFELNKRSRGTMSNGNEFNVVIAIDSSDFRWNLLICRVERFKQLEVDFLNHDGRQRSLQPTSDDHP
jgi:hypothetical protein